MRKYVSTVRDYETEKGTRMYSESWPVPEDFTDAETELYRKHLLDGELNPVRSQLLIRSSRA